MSQSEFQYRPDIDGLRAVAVLLVVLFHVGIPGITGGFVGVDVFFVISGFLITTLLVIEAQAQQKISVLKFYARRVRRLFPALALVLLVTLAVGSFVLLPIFSEQTNFAKSAIASSFYLSNFYFWNATGGYFDAPAAYEPLLHTWSLSVEEQFYLFWPFFVVGVLKLPGTHAENLRRRLAFVFTLVLLGSFIASALQMRSSPQAAYYLMPSRAWEFAIGGLLALALGKQSARSRVGGAVLSAVGIVMVVGSACWLDETSSFPGYNALLPTLGTAAVLAGGALNRESFSVKLLTLRPMIFIGTLSYSWYLWHWPFLALTKVVFITRNDLLRDSLCGLLSLAAAAITYYTIENPIRKHRPAPFDTTRSTLWTGVAVSFVAAGVAFTLGLIAKNVTGLQPAYMAMQSAADDVPPFRKECNHPRDVPFEALSDESQCAIGSNENIRAVLWGDSHADHYSSLMQAFAETDPSVGILQRSFSSCAPFGKDMPEMTTASKACLSFNEAVEREIHDLHGKGLHGVVLSSMWLSMYTVDPPDSGDGAQLVGSAAAGTTTGTLEVALRNLVERLEKEGVKVLIVAPSQSMPHSVPACLARHTPAECAGSRAEFERARLPALEVMRKIAAGSNGAVQIWDPIDALCDASSCFAEKNGTVMFTDALHLSAAGARQLLGSAGPKLNWLVH